VCCNGWTQAYHLSITGLSPLKKIEEVPSGWKKANVSPILKKCKKGNQGNHRPSSLTSGLGKLWNKSPIE